MSPSAVGRVDRLPPLFRRIRYDLALEKEAVARLVEMDLDGCRAALGRLADQLDFSTAGPRQREVVVLLLDVLLRVNDRVHRPSTDGEAHESWRVSLLEQFAAYDDPEDARQAFIPALNRLMAPLRPSAPAGQPSLVSRAQAYIEENHQRRLSLSSVASHLHVSPNYLSRIFHRTTGATLTTSIHQVRLEHARVLLAAGGHSISEVAYLVGYQNYRDFYRNFVKYEHASPRQVQRRLSAIAQDPARHPPHGDPS